MFNKKKTFLLIITLLCCLFMSACQKSEEERAKEEEASLDAVSASIDGMVTSITGEQITIRTSDGDSISFNMKKAELDCNSGIIPGNDVTLIYVGSRQGSDTSNVRLRKIITTDDNSALLADKISGTSDTLQSKTENKRTQPGYDIPKSNVEVEEKTETVYAMYNVNVRADASEDAEILGTLSEDKKITRTGICENGWSRVAYEGKTGYIWGEYLSD